MRKLSILALASGLAVTGLVGTGVAQEYPDRPITWIVPSSPGSAFDVISRIFTPKLSEVLGQSVVIQNITGAGGTIGAATAAEAKPDGYTVLFVNANHTAGEALYKNLTYDLLESFDPIVRLTNSYFVFVVNPSIEEQTLDEVVARAKEHPGEINYASAGVGSVTFMCGELFKSVADIDMTHIPYEGGGPAVASVVSGETDFYCAPYSTGKPFIEDGKVRALAVSSGERLSFLPDLPSASEAVPDFAFISWHGLVAPKGTPPEIREKIRTALIETFDDPKVKEQLAAIGEEIVNEGPEEFAAFLKNEVATMKKIVEDAGIAPQ